MKDQTAASANRKPYDSDLTDAQWSVLKPMLPPPKRRGRPRKTDLREVVNALVCAMRSGRSRRMLLHDLPPWQTVYLLPNVEDRRNAETTPRRPSRRSPPGERAKPRPRRGGHRQPERANRRGIAGMTRAKMNSTQWRKGRKDAIVALLFPISRE